MVKVFGGDWVPRNAFDTTTSLVGSRDGGTSWVENSDSSRRIICVFNTPKEFDTIIINNDHTSGVTNGTGVKDIVITITEDTYTNSTYNAAVTNGTVIFDGVVQPHISSNTRDDQEFSMVEGTGWEKLYEPITTFSGLSDTPSSYDEGKYLRATASGTEWAAISGVLLSDGSVELAGNLLPEMTGSSGIISARNIGSPTQRFDNVYTQDVYVGAGSLYVNGKKVLEDVSDTIIVRTDADQDLKIQTLGTGDTLIESENEINLIADGGVEVTVPSTNPTKHMNFTNQSAGGNITFTSTGANSQVQFSAVDEIDFTAPVVDVNSDMNVSGNFVLGGQPLVNDFYTTSEVDALIATVSGAAGASTFLDLTDTPATYSGAEGKYLRATASGTEWATVSGGSAGASTFLDLTDTPETYSGGTFEYTDTNTKFLLQSDTTNNSTTFTDSSASGHTINVYGDTKHSTTEKKIGLTSIYFDGTGDYIETDDSTDWDFGSENFCIEYWIAPSKNGIYYFGWYNGEAWYDFSRMIIINFIPSSDGKLYCDIGGPDIRMISTTVIPTNGTWTHVAITRSSSTFRLFINGTQEDTDTSSSSLNNITAGLSIGKFNANPGITETEWLQGYMDEIRVVKGSSIYTSNFTPSTTHFSVGGYTGPYARTQFLTINETSNGLEFQDLPNNFIDLDDTPATYSGTEGFYVQSTGSGIQWSEISTPPSTLLDLTDTPSTYSGTSGQYMVSTGSGIEFTDIDLVESDFKAYELINEWSVSSAALDVTISGLTGDTDDIIVLEYFGIAAGDVTQLLVRFNDDTTSNYQGGYIGESNDVTTAYWNDSTETSLPINYAPAGSTWAGDAKFYLKSGRKRSVVSKNSSSDTTDATYHGLNYWGTWNNTASEVISMRIFTANVTTATLRAYKFKKVSIPVKPASLTESTFKAYEQLAEYNLSAQNLDVTISGINGDTDDVIVIEVNNCEFASGTGSNDGLIIRLNNDSDNNYTWNSIYTDGSNITAGSTTTSYIPGATGNRQSVGAKTEIYLKSGKYRIFRTFNSIYNSSNTDATMYERGGYWANSVDEVTTISLYSDWDVTGTIRVYKFKKVALPTVETEANLYRGKQSIKVKWNSNSSFDCLPGNVEIGGTLYNIASTINKSTSSLTASTWYYVYVNPPSTGISLAAANIEYSTTAPTQNTTLMGQYNGSKRCIGAFYSNGSSNIVEFHLANRGIIMEEDTSSITQSTSDWYTATNSVPLWSDGVGKFEVWSQSGLQNSPLRVRVYGSSGDGISIGYVRPSDDQDSVAIIDFPYDTSGRVDYYTGGNSGDFETFGFVLPDDIYTGV
jgi:hypothetical protein